MAKRDSLLVGAAGEHYVAFRLAQMGFVVAIPRGGSPKVDLLVADATGMRTLAIQVKTTAWATRERGRGDEKKLHHVEFPLGHKAAHHAGNQFFYVFVDLQGRKASSNPVSYIVPSLDIQKYCGDWSEKAAMVRWHPAIDTANRYRENWDALVNVLRPIAG